MGAVVLGWLLFVIILAGEYLRLRLAHMAPYDLDILIHAAKRVVAGENPYQLSDTAEHTKLPLLMPLLLPLAALPVEWVYTLWALCTLALLIGCLARLDLKVGKALTIVAAFRFCNSSSLNSSWAK